MISAARQTTAITEPVSSCEFAELVDLYGDSIYKFCRSLAYSKEEAEDLFQETFLTALEKSPKGGAIKNPQGYLFSVTMYLWKSWKRKHARRNRLAPIKPFDENLLFDYDMEYAFIAKEENRIVRAVVDGLPDKFKIPVLMHYSVGMGLTDIAAALNLPGGTVKSRLFKARKLIEKGLSLNGYEK